MIYDSLMEHRLDAKVRVFSDPNDFNGLQLLYNACHGEEETPISKFITLLKLPEDYDNLFRTALLSSQVKDKLISAKHDKALEKALWPLINQDNITITNNHYQDIKRIFKIDKPSLLFGLATLITKYTSSAIFGTEQESPFPLRLYAIALLNTMPGSNRLPPHLDLNDYKKRLLGHENAFTCTSVLSNNIMMPRLKSWDPEMYSIIIPQAWQLR